jgi:hypothetical protein
MAKTTDKSDEPSIEEGLELFHAFTEIKTAADRRKVIALAKRLSGAHHAVKPGAAFASYH